MPLQPLESVNVICPYCGETIDCEIDTSAGGQEFIEDCSVCCNPIVFRTWIDHDSDQLEVDVQQDNT